MAGRLPLSTALSQVLIAHTIELDEHVESVMPHSATVKNGAGLGGGGPWLVSHVMWANYLRHIDARGTPVAVVQERACVSPSTIKSRLNHLSWWAYLVVEPPASAARARQADHVVRLTPWGTSAYAYFAKAPRVVEKRWTKRFGRTAVVELRDALTPFVASAPPGLPEFMPVVDYGDGMRTEVVLPGDGGRAAPSATPPHLSTLLAQTLLLFTLEFESLSSVSLPHLANVLRVVEPTLRPVKEVPLASGVSKEAVDTSVTFLVKAGLVAVDGKGAKATLILTPQGVAERTAARKALSAAERSWEGAYGATAVHRLRGALDAILSMGEGPRSRMAEGLVPHAGAWRAHKRYVAQTEAVLANPRGALPHHPMGLHRGGFPDGS